MIMDNKTLDAIEQKAKESPRLRANLCLHKSPEDKVQKMINVLLPGTEMPIHRHLNSDEVLTLLRGEITIIFYDQEGFTETDRIRMSFDSDVRVVDIPKGQWHNVEVTKPVAVLEIKEGPYRPLSSEEVKCK